MDERAFVNDEGMGAGGRRVDGVTAKGCVVVAAVPVNVAQESSRLVIAELSHRRELRRPAVALPLRDLQPSLPRTACLHVGSRWSTLR